jgi:hypothetical protein
VGTAFLKTQTGHRGVFVLFPLIFVILLNFFLSDCSTRNPGIVFAKYITLSTLLLVSFLLLLLKKQNKTKQNTEINKRRKGLLCPIV